MTMTMMIITRMIITDLRKVDDEVKFDKSDLSVQVLWPVHRSHLHMSQTVTTTTESATESLPRPPVIQRQNSDKSLKNLQVTSIL